MVKSKTKSEVREIVDEWLNNYTDGFLFDISIKYEDTVCIQSGNKKYKRI